MMHWQVVLQALRNFYYDANIFRGFFIFWKYVYFFFEDIQYQVGNEENDKNDQNPENDSHVVDDREVLVSDNWK